MMLGEFYSETGKHNSKLMNLFIKKKQLGEMFVIFHCIFVAVIL